MQGNLPPLLVLLASAVVAVVVCRRLKLPALLGYLLVGILIGPQALGLIDNSKDANALAEFGVVFLMFSIGLEFSLPKLKVLRKAVFGLGMGQVLATILFTLPTALLGYLSWPASIALGGALAMSSTAIVSTLLNERAELNTPHGQQIIGILLFQDLAVVPLLIVIPALASGNGDVWLQLVQAGGKAAIVLAILLYFGQRLLRPWLHMVAQARSSELFTINVLLISLSIAYFTEHAGLSLALGAFLAGMLISETEYRYQVEDDIRPFRDLLLGLFFVSVGMRLNFQQLLPNLPLLLLFLTVLIPGKFLLINTIGKLSGSPSSVNWRTALSLAQAGEFGFVLIGVAAERQLFPPAVEQPLLGAILLSMLAAPFLIQHSDRLIRRFNNDEWLMAAASIHQIAVQSMMADNHVIVCGYGRSGQSLGRLLAQEEISFFALDLDPERVKEAATAGDSVVFGDASKREVLLAAGLSRAQGVVISFNDTATALKILSHVNSLRPELPVIVRTFDDNDIDKLKQAGATEVVAEVLEGSLMLATHAMMLLGVPLNRVLQHIRRVREQRYDLFRGFFVGLSDESLTITDKLQPRLHSVLIGEGAAAAGKTLQQCAIAELVTVKSVKRRNIKGIAPEPQLEIMAGDVLVLLGLPDDLATAEYRLLHG
ncbi:MAG: monovalent cation:proton antiporter-2 (CPA2) family protein [Chitinivorax sp.]